MKLFRELVRLTGMSGIDWFIPALVMMIGLAWLWPEGGLGQGILSLKSLAGYGISVIFFLYGLRLSLIQLLKSLSNWKLHVIIQSVTFLVFPLLILIFRKYFAQGPYENLWLGVFFLHQCLQLFRRLW